MSGYADQPWLQFFTEEQRRDTDHPPSVLHGFLAAADSRPDHRAPAYFDGGQTYRELDTLSDGLARHLAARGFAPGDRLAAMLQNVPQFVVALLYCKERPAAYEYPRRVEALAELPKTATGKILRRELKATAG